MLTEHDNFNLILMPRNVYKALVRSKINLTDIISYKDLRNILSQRDLAELLYINRELKVRGEYLSGDDFSRMLKIEPGTEQAEYDSIQEKLTTLPEIRDSVLGRLYDLSDEENNKPFDIITGTTFLITVIDDGFLKFVETDHNIHLYLSFLFKELYKILPVHVVARLSVFRMYMELL